MKNSEAREPIRQARETPPAANTPASTPSGKRGAKGPEGVSPERTATSSRPPESDKEIRRFLLRFERNYGRGAVRRFKRLVEDPGNSLADVGRHFGFSRENARRVYHKIYGKPYTEAYRRKLAQRREKRLAERIKKVRRLGSLMRIRRRLEALGLDARLTAGYRTRNLALNGHRIAVLIASKPVFINNKEYFRFNATNYGEEDFDFFICLCRQPRREIHFIIPSEAMPRCIVSLLPDARPGQSKYAQFREAWHLLGEAPPGTTPPQAGTT